MMNRLATITAAALLAAPTMAATLPAGSTEAASISLSFLGRYDSTIRGQGAAEIVAHDARNQRLFVVNAFASSVDVLDFSNPASPSLIRTLVEIGGNANSVAVKDGLVAVAFAATIKTDPGKVVLFDASSLERLTELPVGALPDNLVFTPNGEALLVANEGEPNSYGAADSVDPEGSITVIDLRTTRNCIRNAGPDATPRAIRRCLKKGGDVATDTRISTVGFSHLNDQIESLRAAGVRIYGPGATVAQDLEPEYIAVSANSKTAWVSLQEANAIAELDLRRLNAPALTRIIPLGTKDHSLPGNELDASDRDTAINIRNWPLKGLYQPDAVAAFRAGKQDYYITANEGDDRNDFIVGEETRRVAALATTPGLDPAVFGDIASLILLPNLGRMTATALTAPRNAAGQLTEIQILGGRSFSIWAADGSRVFDSGADFERITAERLPAFFNASNDNNLRDDRSDNKGPEPEGVVVGTIAGRVYAFIGLERIGGVMVYDVTEPAAARFVDYVNSRDFTLLPTGAAPTDNGPEGLAFIAAEDSPTGQPLLVVGNEVSGTTAVFGISAVE